MLPFIIIYLTTSVTSLVLGLVRQSRYGHLGLDDVIGFSLFAILPPPFNLIMSYLNSDNV